jgi:hypothetical protein
MSDQEKPDFPSPPVPADPAREALEEPHLAAEELEREIGDSEDWDEASADKDDAPANLEGLPMFPIPRNEK